MDDTPRQPTFRDCLGTYRRYGVAPIGQEGASSVAPARQDGLTEGEPLPAGPPIVHDVQLSASECADA